MTTAINTFLTLLLMFLLSIKGSLTQFNKPWDEKYESNRCPKLYPKNFVNYAPVGKIFCLFIIHLTKKYNLVISKLCIINFIFTGNLTAGNYTEQTNLKGLRQCVMACCLADSCNIVFIYDARCFHVECVSNELCFPLLRAGSRKWESHVSMILVKPVLPNGNVAYLYLKAKEFVCAYLWSYYLKIFLHYISRIYSVTLQPIRIGL